MPVGSPVNEDASEPDEKVSIHGTPVPEEIMKFIQHDTYSLLIKGHAGTGKTTLALTILRLLGSRDDFFYISTRISPKQLFQYYPWLVKFVDRAPNQPPGTKGLPDQIALDAFEDARLDEPESLFERITNQLMDTKSPIIIIDSWDAIASFMEKEARLNNERVLQTWRERAGAKLIFISEHPADTTLDFLVDGIVELRQNNYENMKIREMQLLKLRGVRIERPTYIYTLANSMFRSFAPFRPPHKSEFKKATRHGPIGVSDTDRVGTGYYALDVLLGGGFPRKGIVLLELDAHVNTAVAMALLGPVVSNFVSTGNPVLFQPFDWVDPQAIMNYLGPALPVGKRALFKVLWPSKLGNLSGNLIVPSPNDKMPSLIAVRTMKEKYRGKALLNIMGTDIMRRSHSISKDARDAMDELMSSARAGDLSIAVISRSQKEILEYLSEVADVHLRLLMINDTLFMQPLVPGYNLHALVFEPNGTITLEPIV